MATAPTDWTILRQDSGDGATVVDPRRRLRLCAIAFAVILVFYFIRAVYLEASQGAAYRAAAAAPHKKTIRLDAVRGRILSRDGVVLAMQRPRQSLAVDYRWLEEPADRNWLRREARKRSSRSARGKADQIALAEQAVLRQRSDCHARLAELCGISPQALAARMSAVQARVERIVAAVLRQHEGLSDDPNKQAAEQGLWSTLAEFLRGAVRPARDPPPTTIEEQESPQVIVDEVPPVVAEEVTAHLDLYPGAHILATEQRSYASGAMAAHVVGYVNAVRASAGETAAGQTGIEKQYDALLAGSNGEAVQEYDQVGRLLRTSRTREPQPGGDVSLSIDSRVQYAAEVLLDAALARHAMQAERGNAKPISGAMIVLDVRDGAVWAMASAPRFDLNVFTAGDSAARNYVLHDPREPLFDRALQLSRAPGALFKLVTATALLESQTWKSEQTFFCRGYLEQPDRDRCAIFIRQGVGHGDVRLTDALARGCNVFFQSTVARLPADDLFTWSARLGVAQPTGIDLPGELAGQLDHPRNRQLSQGEVTQLAVGRQSVAMTPLQVARLMAVFASGGLLVKPHLVLKNHADAEIVAGLRRDTWKALCDGLRNAGTDPAAVAYRALSTETTTVAGLPADGWFAGYFPADLPRFVIVVAFDSSVDEATILFPLVRRMVAKIDSLPLESN